MQFAQGRAEICQPAELWLTRQNMEGFTELKRILKMVLSLWRHRPPVKRMMENNEICEGKKKKSETIIRCGLTLTNTALVGYV